MSDAALARVAALIKVEDDLTKIPLLRLQLTKEKASIDANLASSAQLQLELITSNMRQLNQLASSLSEIKSNLQRIHKVHEDLTLQIPDYEVIRKLSGINQFLVQTHNLSYDISQFKLLVVGLKEQIEHETRIVEDDILYQLDQLLPLHYQVTQVRNMADFLTLDSFRFLDDMKLIITRIVQPVKPTVRAFDLLLREIIISITEAVKDGNLNMVERLVTVIEYEHRQDLKCALKDKLGLVDKKDPSTTNYAQFRAQRRNYLKFFFDKLGESLEDTFDKCVEHFAHDQLLVFDNLAWMEDEILFVHETLAQYFPLEWKINQFFQNTYHNKLHAFTMKVIKTDPTAEELLQILAYDAHYAEFSAQVQGEKKLARSIIGEDLKTVVLDDYLLVIVGKMDEWTTNLIDTETLEFVKRAGPPDTFTYHQVFEDDDAQDQPVTLEVDLDVYVLPGFKTPLLMLKEQAEVAIDSGYGKILVGVVQNWSRCYVKRIMNFKVLVDEEFERYMSIYNNDRYISNISKRMRFFRRKELPVDLDKMTPEELAAVSEPGLLYYLVALGNTFEINTYRLEEKFMPQYLEKVHSNFHPAIKEAFEDTAGPSTELNAQVIRTIIDIIVNDLYPALLRVFTKEWYQDRDGDIIRLVVDTIHEYMSDIRGTLSYDMYLCTFAILLDSFIASYIRIGIQNILQGSASKIDPTSTKRHGFVEAIGRDVQYLYVHLEELFTRRDKGYLMNSLRAIEFLGDLATCPDPMDFIPQMWENEILASFYYCSTEYIAGIVSCRKDSDKNTVLRLVPILSRIQTDYHKTVEPPSLLTGTLTDFFYN